MPIDNRTWTAAWSADQAPDTPGDWPALTAGTPPLVLTGSYTPNQSTGPLDADGIGVTRVNQALSLAADASFTLASGLAIPAGVVVWRVIATWTTSPGIRFLVQNGTAGAAYLWVWVSTGTIWVRIYDAGVSRTFTLDASILTADGWGDGSPLIIDAVAGADFRAVWVNARSSSQAGDPGYLGSTADDLRIGARGTGETYTSPVLFFGRADGADAAWWSPNAHLEDVAAALWDPVTPTAGPSQESTADVPTEIEQGTTATWSRTVPEYTPTDGWTLRFIMSTATERHEASVVPSGDSYNISFTATETAAMSAGRYEWRAYVESGTARFGVDSGEIHIRPSALTSAVDLRTQNEIYLDAIEAALGGRASRDQQSMQINGRAIQRQTVDDLMKLRAHYIALVRQEKTGSASQLIRTRFE